MEPDLMSNPTFSMIGKAKKIDMEIHTNSFRKIKSFFEQAKAGDNEV
jgi:predicted transcriptional regulator YdeE